MGKMRHSLLLIAALLPLLLPAQTYDTVLANGRVIDPASGLDEVRHIGIRSGRIAAISQTSLSGKVVVDIKGLVVSPGFIDLHSHGQTPENYRFKARDGVATAVESEVGVWPVQPWYSARRGKTLINYGATVGHIPARMSVMGDTGSFLPRDEAANRVATKTERQEIRRRLEQGLAEGSLGIGFGLEYVPQATREEILDLFGLAASSGRPCFVHLRHKGTGDPGVVNALQEVIGNAAVTSARVHIMHIASAGLRSTALALRMIESARKFGIDVSTETYPYTASFTRLDSAVFSDGWQQRYGISYEGLQWVETGERLTADSFARYRQKGGFVIVHAVPAEAVREALASPAVMVGSDGLLENGKGHPRAAGTFARVLAHYVREEKVISLMDAIRKMSYLPAQKLGLPAKGRIQVGADADLTVFDPDRVADRATFDNPAQYSEGIPYVLVAGMFVVRDSQLQDVTPGSGITAVPSGRLQ